MRTLLLFFLISHPLFAQQPQSPVRAITINGIAQGTTYHITYYSSDSTVTRREVDSIFASLDSSLSLYKPYSLVNRFNASGHGLITDVHLRKVVDKAIQANKFTQGIFDITVYPFTEAWGFGNSKPEAGPTPERIKQLKPCVGRDKIYWSANKLMKKKPCVRLDPNGIAQGYSVDVLGDFLDIHGITDWLVEVGGEIKTRGRKQPSNEPMKIAIEMPGDDGWNVSLSTRIICVENGAITTSGSYRKYVESNGRKISHILDARTGYPAKNDLISVTVYAADAITADAFDNALMVMGMKKALAFTESRSDIAAYFIYRKNDGSITDTVSTRFRSLFLNTNNR